jgi:hypothetical protein
MEDICSHNDLVSEPQGPCFEGRDPLLRAFRPTIVNLRCCDW